MSRELLCTWLDLPEAPWPPGHYALLGLPAGNAATDEIEQRVLERMDLLRRYQLMHPEQVTEGMNLLAQAMICLTDPESRRQYDQSLGLAPSEPESFALVPLEFPAMPLSGANSSEPQPPRVSKVSAAPAPNLPAALTLPNSSAVSAEVVPDAILIPELVDEAALPLLVEEEEAYVKPRPRPAELRRKRPGESRRKIYADIVRIRRALRYWERIRAYLDDPEKAFSRRTDTVTFMAWLSELRPILPTIADLVGGVNQPGSLVAALARQQLIVEMFRSLLPSQRDALSKDCRQAHYILLERYAELRAEVRRQTAKHFVRRVWHPLVREIIARPEWLLLVLGIVALVIAFVRSVPK